MRSHAISGTVVRQQAFANQGALRPTLYMLSLAEENREDIVFQDGVRCVVAMCILEGSTSPLIQGICARTLCLLSCHDDVSVRSRMVQDGAVRVSFMEIFLLQ